MLEAEDGTVLAAQGERIGIATNNIAEYSALIAGLEKAAELGVEAFVVDDGWFRGRTSDRAGLGDWQPDPAKFPEGLAPLADAVVEDPDPAGFFVGWQAVVDLAVLAASDLCVTDLSSCRVATATNPDGWFAPDDPNFAPSGGTLSTRLLGCGAGGAALGLGLTERGWLGAVIGFAVGVTIGGRLVVGGRYYRP